ncbi:aspartyl-phosphate phosphatase Spo0E family protein [Paenibacillus tarimensis]|nr:aspartyl-phosphate phosphatase Spo0E family protein [Paenibacillus tarimensis]MCF2942734.1 aspartyl-phosphate phosphatase Spo0E family protein [Paenibacillus tarimensis]
MSLADKIVVLKDELLQVAEKNYFNLLHPEVITMSQKLDTLIVQSMKNRR